jgi:hypothetical protein
MLTVIAWIYLMHAYYRGQGIEYCYLKKIGKKKQFDKISKGTDKYWELERCINDKERPLDAARKNNPKFLIGIRREIEHQVTNQIDKFSGAKLRACELNYGLYISPFSGQKFTVAEEPANHIHFSAVFLTQKKLLDSVDRPAIYERNYVAEFEDALSESEPTGNRYAHRVLFTPINENREDQAGSVIVVLKPDS